jgi:hypothetical protein
MKAKYAGKCRECGGRIRKGDEIDWSRGGGAIHARCRGNDISASEEKFDAWMDKEAEHDGEPLGLTYSRYDRYGVYAADGHKMGSTCGCIDYPCCGH